MPTPDSLVDLLSKRSLAAQFQDKAKQAALEAQQPTASPGSAPRGIGPWPYVAALAGNGLDTGSTLAVLNQGGRELNPVLGQSPGRITATKAAVSAGEVAIMKALAKSNPTLAKILGYGAGALAGAAGIHNLTQLK